MKHTSKFRSLAATLFTIGTLTGGAKGAVTFTAEQIGSDIVVSSVGGSFDLTSFSFSGSAAAGLGDIRIYLGSFSDAIYIGTGSVDGYDGSISDPTITVSFNQFADAATGTFYGIFPTADRLFVPSGYVSGDALPSSSATYFNTELSDWGLTVGDQFTWTWGAGANADSATFLVIGQAIPEPSTTLLFGLAALGFSARRRR